MQQILTKGLQATAARLPVAAKRLSVRAQGKGILANPQQDAGQHVRERYLAMLAQTGNEIATLGLLGHAFEHLCHITNNFAVGFFQCYDIEGLPTPLMIWSNADGAATDS